MGKEKSKRYSKEFKEQILKECIETNNYNLVARKNNIPPTTVYTWIRKHKNESKLKNSNSRNSLEKEWAELHRITSIKKVEDIFQGQRIDLPEVPGVYAFWWVGNRQELLQTNRHIVLKGPSEQLVDVEFME